MKAVGSQSVQATVHFNGPTVRLIRHQSTDTLTENQYEKIVSETLESLSDYFDELLENQTKIANYDLSLSVSFKVPFERHNYPETRFRP